MGLCVDKMNRIIIAHSGNNRIRMISADRTTVTTVAGAGNRGHDDGPLLTALFSRPVGVVVRDNGDVVATESDNTLRIISQDSEQVVTVNTTDSVSLRQVVGVV